MAGGELHYRSGRMDQARTELRASDSAKAVASWTDWDAYYREAARRRRARGGGQRSFREEKRRRRLTERFSIGVSALFVAALTSLFYAVLTR